MMEAEEGMIELPSVPDPGGTTLEDEEQTYPELKVSSSPSSPEHPSPETDMEEADIILEVPENTGFPESPDFDTVMEESTEKIVEPKGPPEREPLLFLFDPANVDGEMANVMESIKQLAEKMLYHWKTFPIALPHSVTETRTITSEGGSLGETPGVVSFKDMFKAPTFDELEEVSKDSSGNQRRLQDKQLQTILETGEFEVDSIHFKGQAHRWRLTQLLQKGSVRARLTLLNDLALALRLLIITAKNRLHSHFFSLSNSITGWYKGLWKLLDIIMGMPWTSPGDIMSAVHEEHMRYLVAELDIKSNCRREFNTFCAYVKEKCQMLREEKHKTTDLKPPPIPYSYQTPKGQDIDLRLFNKDLMNHCLPVLQTVLEDEAKGWHIQHRQKLLREFKEKGLNEEELSERVSSAIMEEYLKRVFHAILTNSELEDKQTGIGQLLVDQAKSMLAMEEAAKNVNRKMKKHKDELIVHLKKSCPIKSRITAWMNDQLHTFEEEFVNQNLWSAHEAAISICEEEGLEQAVYFLKRDLAFIKEREPILKKELGKVKIPNRVFAFATRIWLPKNWVVLRHYRGQTVIVPTFLTSKPALPSPSRTSPSEESYTVEKYQHRKTTTRYPMWRWWNYCHRTWAWTWNVMFWLGVVIPWCSPVSFRALFYIRPFRPDYKLSQTDGVLYPAQSSLTQTLISRLRSLWSHVRLSRSKFEEEPDTGFLGKSFTRHLNRFWNYVIKGAFGSMLLVTVFPVVCITVSLISLIIAAISPVWVPVVSLLSHIFFFLIYDFDAADDEGNRICIIGEAILFRILVQGCLQPIAALIVGLICCPLAALFVTLFATIRRGGRGLWDTIMFHLIIKKRGRVPWSDGFVARRISGPGLASNYFFQIRPEQALAALEARIEMDELKAWEDATRKVLNQPVQEFREFTHQCFQPFSASITEKGVFANLIKETRQYEEELQSKVDIRTKRLNTGVAESLRTKVKLPEKELKWAISSASELLEKVYSERVLSRLEAPEGEFWEKHQLEMKDWKGLACKIFMEIFSKSFLVPLEETDNQFELKVEHMNLSRYIEMLKTSEYHDDLDSVLTVHRPPGDYPVRAPQLDEAFFNPNHRKGDHTSHRALRRGLSPWKPMRTELQCEKLEIPLPVPHPASIAVSIYNREHDQEPIQFEDMYCQRILRATREVPYVDIGDPIEMTEQEPSTPDNVYEPIDIISHLAEQERSFSEESVATNSPRPRTKGVKRVSVVSERKASSETTQENVVYSEQEMDNRCVHTPEVPN